MHTPKKLEKQQENAQLTKHDAFVYWSSSCAVCWWPIFRKLGTCSTTDALWARTLLTEKSCESVQQILQHSPAGKKKKKKKKKRSTHQTWCLSLLVLFLSNVVVGDGQEGWRMLLSTVPLRRISRLGQYWQKTFVDVITRCCNISPITMPFLTVSAITCSWIAWTATQADSWWIWHVEPDDVVIADIAGQAFDIFLHGPESARKNGIGKTFTHTSIPIHPCTLLKKCKNNNSKMLNSPNMTPLFPGPLPVPCAGGRFSGSLAPDPRRTPCRLGHF